MIEIITLLLTAVAISEIARWGWTKGYRVQAESGVQPIRARRPSRLLYAL